MSGEHIARERGEQKEGKMKLFWAAAVLLLLCSTAPAQAQYYRVPAGYATYPAYGGGPPPYYYHRPFYNRPFYPQNYWGYWGSGYGYGYGYPYRYYHPYSALYQSRVQVAPRYIGGRWR